MHLKLIPFVRRVGKRWAAHGNTQAAAGIAYYALFTLAPVLIFATALAGWFISEQQARELAQQFLAQAIGPDGAQVAQDVFTNADFKRHGSIAMTISALALLYGASSSFWQLRAALDRIFGRAHRSRKGAVVNWIVGRVVSARVGILVGDILLGIVIGSTVLHETADRLAAASGLGDSLWHALGVLLSTLSFGVIFMFLYRLLPSSHPPWRQIWSGAIVSALGFELGKWIFGYYIARSLIATVYGPSSCLVAFLVWIYYSAQILLLGAEICALNDNEPD